ncbi:hypothetical protein BURCENBC7_AP7556 [Burkholderia cenocepacia BC7]|nr:uncharacterized protein BCN122_I2184 [Burkholderia cenocepacia]EPZ86398.1 hypothetical protein BURCENK562V_C6423 [Burkholderia cenocepacia K56-2Valvano]ERI27517.1 hypothetical protein BURCENBC7_AP7556 [Burkholderia cenocepacia BC7]CDN60839.1 hypothetical protein I35_2316 [Burkholderia cenocepacia H111]
MTSPSPPRARAAAAPLPGFDRMPGRRFFYGPRVRRGQPVQT